VALNPEQAAARKTGLDRIGDVSWGTHFCQFYKNKEDLVDILVPYFKAGLENNEFCMWITSEPLNEFEAEVALRDAVPDLDWYMERDQIEIIPHTKWYLKDGVFESQRVLDGWVKKLDDAMTRGFDGLRLSGNTFWLEDSDWENFTNYEETVESVIDNYNMIAMCTYSLNKCTGSEIVDVVRNHQFALIKYDGKWDLIESSELKRTKTALKQNEIALQRSKKKYKGLFTSMNEGVALHELVYDERGNSIDYVIKDVNPKFESITGINREIAIGKRASMLYGTRQAPYLDIYAEVARTRVPTHFETYFPPMDKHFRISVYSPSLGEFATVFSDITDRKKADEEREQLLNERNAELELSNLLLRVAESLALSLNLDEILNRLARLVLEATGRSRVFINLIDMNKRELIPKIATGGLKALHGQTISFDRLSQTSLKAIFAKKVMVADYELPEVPEYDKKIAQANNSRLVLFVPLLLKGEIIGHISLDEPGQRHQFLEREIEIVKSIASQAAIAIENARLHDKTEMELSRTKLLQDIAIAATSSTNLEAIADKVLTTIRRHLDLKIGIIRVLDETNQIAKLISSFGLQEAFIRRFQEVPLEKSSLFTAKAIKENRTLTHEDEALTAERLETIREAGVEKDRYIMMPIEYQGKTLGLLSLTFKGRRSFTEGELELFHAITHTIGQAIENARLFAIEHNVADTLQNALLVMPDKVDGVEFGHLYHAAYETAQVGGDFYDLFEIDHNRVGIIIGDVSGKGLDAAIITSRAKNALKAFSYEYDTPADIVSRTNNMLIKNTSASVFVTLFFGILNTDTGELIYCSAGHPPALLKRVSGVELLEEHSPIVGAFAEVSFANTKVILQESDTLVLYTDGLTEARRGSEFFGEERLVSLIQKLEPESTKHLPQQIFDEVMGYTNGKLTDDLALFSVSLINSDKKARI
jgi:serine phosphatase RsbU (regulator of sigma subunit)/PAS domain-containing protein